MLLIIHLLLRGERRPAIWAAATAAVLSVTAALVGRPLELWNWRRDVAPEIGRGSLHVWNQAVVGWFARLTSSGHVDFAVQRTLPQIWSLLAYGLAGLAIVTLWRHRRNRPIVPLELGVIVLVASPATVAALLYLAVVVRLSTRMRHLEDDEARAHRDDRAHADPSSQRYSFA